MTENRGLMTMRQRKIRGWTTLSQQSVKDMNAFCPSLGNPSSPSGVHRPDPTQAAKCPVLWEEKHLPAQVGVGGPRTVEETEAERGKTIPSLS